MQPDQHYSRHNGRARQVDGVGVGIITRASSRVIRWRSSQKVARNFFESEMQTLARAPSDAACLNLGDHNYVDEITS